MKKLSLILFVLFLFNLPAPAQTESAANATFAVYQKRSIDKYKLEDYEGSLEDMLQALEAKPLDGNFKVGYITENLRNLRNSKRIFDYYNLVFDSFEKAVNTNKTSRKTTLDRIGMPLQIMSLDLADLYEEKGDVEKARQTLERMVRFEPRNMAYYYRAEYYKGKGRFAEARADEIRITEYHIEVATTEIGETDSTAVKAGLYTWRANLHLELNRFDEAIADYEAAIAVYKNKDFEQKSLKKIIEAKQRKLESPNPTN